MHISFEELVSAFVFLWAVIDPIGTVPVFIVTTQRHRKLERRRIAYQSVSIAAGILLFFLIAGEFLLELLGIPLIAFQITGGIILFLFSLTMIFGDSKPEEEINIIRKGRDTAIFPLAIPSIASPGAIMAVVLLTDNHRFDFLHQFYIAIIMLLVLVITLFFLLLGPYIHKRIGDSGASLISRIMGLILASIAVNNVLMGIKEFFAL